MYDNDYLTLIRNKQSNLAVMYARMDNDAAMFHSHEYKMKAADDKTEVPNILNVTLLDAAQFLDKSVARLAGVERQVLVEGEHMSGDETSKVEEFLTDLQFESDARLSRKGEAEAFTQHAELVCARGPIVEQNLLRVAGGELVPDSRPIDSRWFTYEMSDDKMIWGCCGSRRTKADISIEYGYDISSDYGIVLDFYNDTREAIFVEDEQVDERENPYGYPPFVIAFPATSSALRSHDYIQRLGDSILHSLRTANGKYLFNEKNYVASNLKTLSSKSIKPDLQFPSTPGPDGEPHYQALPPSYPDGTGAMLQTSQPAVLVPRPDVALSTTMFSQMIDTAIQRGTYASLDYGVIDMPLSAVAISRLAQSKDELLLPRLNCIAALWQASANMKIKQFLFFQEALSLGQEGHRRSYSPVDLEGEYTVKFRFHTSSQEQMASAASIATALGPLVSDEFKQDIILNLQDPAGERAKLGVERSRKADPALDLFDQMKGYIDAQEAADDNTVKAENDVLARLILARIVSILKQRQASENQPMPINLSQDAKVSTPGSPGIPVFTGGGVKTQ